jgi:hypothetical protein
MFKKYLKEICCKVEDIPNENNKNLRKLFKIEFIKIYFFFISIYVVNYNENQEKEKMFLFGGDNLATEENIEKTISDIIPKDEESNVSHTILVNEIESIK